MADQADYMMTRVEAVERAIHGVDAFGAAFRDVIGGVLPVATGSVQPLTDFQMLTGVTFVKGHVQETRGILEEVPTFAIAMSADGDEKDSTCFLLAGLSSAEIADERAAILEHDLTPIATGLPQDVVLQLVHSLIATNLSSAKPVFDLDSLKQLVPESLRPECQGLATAHP